MKRIQFDFQTRKAAIKYLLGRGWKRLTPTRGHVFWHPEAPLLRRAIEKNLSGIWKVRAYK